MNKIVTSALFFKNILIIFLFALISTQLPAQSITNYTFSSSTGTFTALSTPNATTWLGTTDDGGTTLIPIGFDFWYMGTRYTDVAASTNGWLSLGAVQTDYLYTNNLSASGTPRPVIAPLWDDLDIVATSNVTYKTTGTTGSRIFTIQYLNVKWNYLALGSVCSFQVKCYEGTGRVEFVYRSDATIALSPSASIGITGTGTGPGNYLAVNNAGSNANSVNEPNITSKPVSGKTYDFSPPVPTAPGSLTFSDVSSTVMTLNWTDLSSNERIFAIYVSTDGVNYTFHDQTAANTTSSSETGLTLGVTYYWKVYAVTEGALSTALSGSQITSCAGAPTVSTTTTVTCVGGSTGSITVTATGGTSPFTYSLNAGAYRSSVTFDSLAANTYTLNVKNSTGCVVSTPVTVSPYANSTDNQNTAGTDSWVGHVYDGIIFNSYIGHYTETEVFNEFFGGALTCFNVISNSVTRSIFTESFSIKYRMTSTKKGLYIVDIGADDGNRLTVDGVMPFNSWTYQSYVLRPSVLINLNGASSLMYEYFESNGNNQIAFQNLTLVFSNTLSTNATQSICIGNSGAAISGDTYGTLPSGITLSGTGYQWSYSTTAGGTRITLAGATSATFTPSGSVAPFNAPGVYYVFRNAALSSVNNVSPSPYVATNESNTAIITVNAAGQWTGSTSTDWTVASNWCTGAVPTAATNVEITATAVNMPVISSTATCNQLTINAGATLTTTSAGILNIGGTLINNGTMTNNGTTDFNGTSGQQTFTGVSSFYNLTLNNSGGLLLPGAITINNNLVLTAGILTANNFNILVKGNWTNNASTGAFVAGTNTVTFNGTAAQAIEGTAVTTFNNIIIDNTGSAVSLTVNSSISGNLLVTIGIFDLGAFTANRASSGGTLTLSNNTTLKIGGTNTYPANYANNTLVVASTVEYSGTNQTVANELYGNLKLSSSTGGAVKTFPGTPLTIVGNLTSTLGTGTSLSFTAASDITVDGNVSVGTSTIFNGGSYTHTMGGNWTNSGTFNGNTGTIVFSGAGSTVSGSGQQLFNNLTVTASLMVFSSASISLSGNLATTGAGSFSQASGDTLLMTGSGKNISGPSIVLHTLVSSGTVTTATSFELTGNLYVSGSLIAGDGTITMSGTSKTISGAGVINFRRLSVQGAITTNTDFGISSGLTVNGSLSASAGTAIFTDTATLSGIADLFNATINGTSLQLSTGSILGIAHVLTISAGVLNVTSSIPNAVNFNGSGVQNINAIAYNNLLLSNGNTKTATGSITVNGNVNIGTGTTFAASTFTHYIYKDWSNNGSFTAGTGTIQFLGDETAHINGATTFNILTINNINASTSILLLSNVTAVTVNMTEGNIFTGADTLTITATRTGNGIILGNIRRTHAFTTGVAYAFEGPDNTISFAAVSGVTSITVAVADGVVNDFPFGGSISRLYTIAVPTGSYTATLRLHYEDDELNGSVESSMGLWRYNGAAWAAVGKTANSATTNYAEQSGLTNITDRWTLSDNSNVVRWNGSVSTAWNTAANWTVVQGAASTPPAATDIVNLGTVAFTYAPTISTMVSVKNINFGSTQATVLSMASGGSLITGDIHGTWSGASAHTIHANNQSITINGDLMLSDGVNGHVINLTLDTGTVSIQGY